MGLIRSLREGQELVVAFTFKGSLDSTKAREWNKAIEDLKHRFGPKLKARTLRPETARARKKRAR